MARMSTSQELFEKKFVKTDGCWNWTANKYRSGYGQFGYGGLTQQAHRVAYQLYIGPIPDGLCVLHRCDNPGCVRPDHLFLGTQADNVHDCIGKGRKVSSFGEKNGNAKLTAEQVAVIREKRANGALLANLAEEFNISESAVSLIANRRNWASI